MNSSNLPLKMSKVPQKSSSSKPARLSAMGKKQHRPNWSSPSLSQTMAKKANKEPAKEKPVSAYADVKTDLKGCFVRVRGGLKSAYELVSMPLLYVLSVTKIPFEFVFPYRMVFAVHRVFQLWAASQGNLLSLALNPQKYRRRSQDRQELWFWLCRNVPVPVLRKEVSNWGMVFEASQSIFTDFYFHLWT